MSQQSILPEGLERVTLLKLGESTTGYTVPWAMYADPQGRLWLNGNYPFVDTPFGTSTLRVTKTNGEYCVSRLLCRDYRWEKSTPMYLGAFTPIPVAKLD